MSSIVNLRTASLLSLFLTAPLAAQSTILISRDSAGVQGNWHSDAPLLSGDGRYVAFQSQATNLVPNDNNQTEDVFLHDRLTGATSCISVTAGGQPVIAQSVLTSFSRDGRYVAFWSSAWNVVPTDANFLEDVFLRDLQTGTTTRVSVSSSGVESDGSSHFASVSDDGHFVAFESRATNLVAGDTNGAEDVFLSDTLALTTTRLTHAWNGAQTNGASLHPVFSSDARWIVFSSRASNLVPTDTNGFGDIFICDVLSGSIARLSSALGGGEPNGESINPVISADGRFVVFESLATNLVANDTNVERDVFIHDRATGVTERVSVDSVGAQANEESSLPSVSGDGRFVVFLSKASNLVAGDTNIRTDHFLHDRATGVTTRVSVDSAGNQGDGICYALGISSDGQIVAFSSLSSNLVAGDTNTRRDVFVRDRFLRPTIYCTAGTTTHGCQPVIASSGSPSASATSGFTIQVSSVEGLKSGIIFYGLSGRVALPWASGSTSYLCVKPPTQRTPAQSSGGTLNACNGSLSLDLLAFTAANPGALGQPIAMGQRLDAQAWFRDPVAPKMTNLSDALEFDLVP